MKFAARSCSVDLTEMMSQPPSTGRFMENTHIKAILFLQNTQELALVRTSSLLLLTRTSSTVSRAIQLGFDVDQVSYLPQINRFYAYRTTERQFISFSNDEAPDIVCLYDFNENKVKIQYEWAPWILTFQASAKIALVRKLYGESIIVVFNNDPTFQKYWQFTCNQSSISKLDDSQYLVNFDETNNKFSIKIAIYDCEEKEKTNYKIENLSQNICKGVKLYDRSVDKSPRGQSRIWLKSVIGVNYKANGSGILLVNLLQGSNNNHYEVISTITHAHSEINVLLNASALHESLQLLEFRYDQQSKQTGHFLTNYKLNEFQSHLLATEVAELDYNAADFAYCCQSNELVTLSNQYVKSKPTSSEGIKHFLQLNEYRAVQRGMVYLHLLQQYSQEATPSFLLQVLKIL